jgi:ligand-binding SRPBCC domain-containing protein
MPTIELETLIHAPPEVCFDLVRDIRVHPQTHEGPVSGVTDGKIGLGQTVTFEGKHLRIKQRLTVRVIEFDRPRRFVDAMIEGRFRSFVHIHEFNAVENGTQMRDTLDWESPFGILGRVVDSLVLRRHLTDLVTKRNSRLKAIAENEL